MKKTALSLVILGSLSAAHAAQRPNIVFVFNDDHTRQAIGAYNDRFEMLDPTPNIDKMAEQGMRFDRAYVGNSICAPSRATVLTGKHSHKNGKFNNQKDNVFDHDQQTFPKLLQQGGYKTALIGKTHLGHGWGGFDHLDYFPMGGDYYNPIFTGHNNKRTQVEGYVTDVIMERGIDWMESQRQSGEPFMLALWNKAPHREFLPAIRHADKWHDIELPLPATLYDDYENRPAAAMQTMHIDHNLGFWYDLKVLEMEDPKDGTQMGGTRWHQRMTDAQRSAWDAKRKPMDDAFLAQKLTGNELFEWKYQRYVKDYLRTSYAIDESIGELMEYLEKSGLAENTIIVYSSDQGFFLGEHGWYDKRFMYEESYSTPLIVRWPAAVKAGSVNADLVQNIDFAPTFLDLAGVDIPEDVQGKSLVPLFKGETPEDWRKSLYYHYVDEAHDVRPHEGVSTDQFKLIRFYGKDFEDGEFWEFYDNQRDPEEINNAIDNPEYKLEIKRLKKELAKLRKKYEVPDGWPALESQ
ncbi:sulfatase [Ferrimonas pelagia]|uniref:Sulfatase n=1 Tax=Ferrimonas pelagia TaxID=1177826 RepID=A0ABP9FI00_9GAMM